MKTSIPDLNVLSLTHGGRTQKGLVRHADSPAPQKSNITPDPVLPRSSEDAQYVDFP